MFGYAYLALLTFVLACLIRAEVAAWRRERPGPLRVVGLPLRLVHDLLTWPRYVVGFVFGSEWPKGSWALGYSEGWLTGRALAWGLMSSCILYVVNVGWMLSLIYRLWPQAASALGVKGAPILTLEPFMVAFLLVLGRVLLGGTEQPEAERRSVFSHYSLPMQCRCYKEITVHKYNPRNNILLAYSDAIPRARAKKQAILSKAPV